MAEASINIHETISGEDTSAYYARRTSEALDLLYGDASVSNLPGPRAIYSIEKLKYGVVKPNWDIPVGEYATPVWNIFAMDMKGFELIGLTQEEVETLGPILPAKTPAGAHPTELEKLKSELVPQILFALKVLDYDKATFQNFVKILTSYPEVGITICEILCDDKILAKARPFLVKKSFDEKREILFQFLKKDLGICTQLSIIHMMASCGDQIENIVLDEMSFLFFNEKFSPLDIAAIVKVASFSSLIKMCFRWCNLNDESIVVLRDGLSKSNVKIHRLDISDNPSIDVKGWSCVGELVKNHKVEDFNLNRCELTYDKLDAFNKSSGDFKIHRLDISGNCSIDVKGWSCIGELVKNHKVEELNLNRCELTYDKLDAFNKISGDSKIRKLDIRDNPNLDERGFETLGYIVKRHDIDSLEIGGDKMQTIYNVIASFCAALGGKEIRHVTWSMPISEIDERLMAVCKLSLKVANKLRLIDFFRYDLNFSSKAYSEVLILLRDFVHVHHRLYLMIEFEFLRQWNLPTIYPWESCKTYVRRLQESQLIFWQIGIDLREPGLYSMCDGHIKLAPIGDRIQMYQKRFPRLQWDSERVRNLQMSTEAVALHFKADLPRISILQASGEGSTSSIGENSFVLSSFIKLRSSNPVGDTDSETIFEPGRLKFDDSTEFGLQTSLIKLQYSKAARSTKAFSEEYSDSETIFEPGPLKVDDSAKFDCFDSDENVSSSSSKKQGYKILQLPKSPTQKSLSKTLQIANEDLKPDSADALSASLLQAMMMFDEGKYARGFLLVKDALPDSISAADVHKLGKELEEDSPVCAIILHHVSCVHHNSEAPSPENTLSWINDRITDIGNIAGTVMNYECDKGFGHSVITCCLKSIEDLLFKIRSIDNVTNDVRVLAEASCILTISKVALNAANRLNLAFNPSIITLCKEGLSSLQNQFGDSVLEHHGYIRLLNSTTQAFMKIGEFAKAKDYLEKALRANDANKGKGGILYREMLINNVRECEMRISSEAPSDAPMAQIGADDDEMKLSKDLQKLPTDDGSFLGEPSMLISPKAPLDSPDRDIALSDNHTQALGDLQKLSIDDVSRGTSLHGSLKFIKDVPDENAVTGDKTSHEKDSGMQHSQEGAAKLVDALQRSFLGEPSMLISPKATLDSPNTDIAGDDLKLSDNLQKLSTDGRQEAILFPLQESVDSPDAIICESTHENDSDPPYWEEGVEKLVDPSQKAPLESISVEPLICPANCFELSILAKQSNDADLQRLVNDYVTKNLKIIATSESLISLSMSDFKKYLESCGLPYTAKLDLVEAKFLLSVNIETTDGSQLKGVELELAKLAAGLSTNYRNKYQTLTTYCHLLLKRHLSDSNCLETAIFAKSCRLDELKVWAEYHVIVNFQSVLANVSTAAYSKEEVTKFCEICSIPDEMRDMLMGQSGPRYEQPEFQKIASKWLLSELRKLSSVKTKTIGVEGGIIELDGCCVNFPKDALSQDTYITLTINTDPKNYPENTLAITPIIDIEPSMSLKQPASVTLKTCFVASSGQTITAQLFTSHGSVWEESPITINLCSEPEIIFRVDHFSGLLVGVPTTSDGKYIFYNDLYIQHETGLISSCFYYQDKDGRDKRKDMRTRNCSCFSPTSLRIIGHADEKIKLSVTLEKPEVESLARKRWLPVLKTIKDVLIQTEFALDPGDPVSSLEVGSLVSGIYVVFIGSESEPQYSAYVKRKWPVTLDPEHTSHNVTANVYNDRGNVKTECNSCKHLFAGGYKDE